MMATQKQGREASQEQGREASVGEQRTTITDPGMIRALSHPARLSIIEHLAATGDAATATELAQLVRLSPSATSYHLREMAKHGLVEEAEGRGDGRERRWRRVSSGFHVESDTGATGERRRAEEALLAAVLARANERAEQWFARSAVEPAEWADAGGVSDSSVLVTPEELTEIRSAFEELIRPYLRRHRTDPPAGARPVSMHLRMVPLS